jgi:hypothetical protein
MGMALLAPAVFAQDLRYDVWHGHSRLYSMPPHFGKAGAPGTLTITGTGVSFEQQYEKGKKPRHPQVWNWDYPDIQQLKISSKTLSVLTYQDNKWKLGADREYDFDLVSDNTFEDAYHVLKTRLDQRFVAAIADSPSTMLWEIPAKHLAGFGGDEGVLQVGFSEIVYKSAKKAESRTWRYEDIDNISSAGPFELTITTFERAKLDYGNRKQFNFSLKQRLDETRYNELWLRLDQSKGLKILNSYRGAGAAQ